MGGDGAVGKVGAEFIKAIARHRAWSRESAGQRVLSQGEAVLLVLIPSHRELLVQQLSADGFDVAGLQHDGHLVLRDAAELVTGFMPGARRAHPLLLALEHRPLVD